MVLGEVILAAILGMLLTRLTSPEFLRFINGLGCQKKMKKWIEFLPMLMAVLDDAEEKQQKDKTAKGWVCISEEFDVKRVTKAILESITSQSCELQELNDVQVKLRKELTRKKLLLVLDDVWNKNYAEWQELKSPFSAAAPGILPKGYEFNEEELVLRWIAVGMIQQQEDGAYYQVASYLLVFDTLRFGNAQNCIQ
ncbi:hypothetical protein P3X46_000724 [Hevea brasiliensis]|uniref:NB-ARC domain-containing protein n=1 Tax=Hevea brasiliensis TaxID=3981 RepID=A0ABQ9NDD8_HEVBR|nr:hypothetical protein P3X46_000724 [Hevea brasiliensis]